MKQKGTDCLICQEKLYLQEKFLDNLKIGNQCQQDCDFGYEQVKIIENGQTINQCKVCTKNCDSCINTLQKVQPRFVDEYIFNSSNINPNKYFCVEACPKYTFHNTETRECKLETILSFIFDENNNHIQQKYFTTDLIKFNLEIQSPYDLPEDTIVSCTILEINQYLQMQQNQFSKMFSSVINANILKEGRVYTLKCIVYMFKQKFENTTKIETLKLIAGEFSSNSTRGIAILDSFSFSINSYQFENISKEHYHFDYAVYVEKPVYNSQFMNFTLFQTNQAFYNQHPHLLTNFKYTLNYTFPYIKNSKIVRIILVATFQKIKDYQTIELKIDPFYINVTDVQTLIQKTILENNLQIGDPFNSEILGQFHNELLTLNIIPQLYPELLSYKKETNLLLQLLSYQTNCQSNVDCSNQGNCLKQIYSSYQKCQCNLGFLGEYCQWNAENYIEIQKIYLQSLPQLKYEIVQLHISQQSNQFKINKQKFNFPFLSFLKQTFKIRYNNVIEQIFQLCQMQDIINFQMSEMLAEIVLSQFFVHDKVILLNLEKVAFIVDVLLDLTIKFSELAQIDQTDKFQKLIHGILNIFNKIISNQGQKIQHKFNNLSVLIQDLTVMKNITLNSFQIVGYDVSVSLPIRQQLNQENNLQFMIFKHTIGFIKQKVDLDSDKFSIFASDIIVLMLKDKNEKNKSIYFVNEDDFVLLDIPISVKQNKLNEIQKVKIKKQVKLEDTTRDKQKNFTYKCVQLIQNSTWSSQNIQMDIFDDFIRCKVRNLTSYAIQIVKSEKQNLQNESQNIEQPSETEISDSQLNPYVFFSINASALVFVQFAFIYYNTLKKKNLTKTPLQQEENQENNNQLQQEIKSEEKNDTEKVILQKQLVQGTSETEQFQQNAIFRTLEFQECKKENKADECFQVGQEVENFNKQQQLSQLNQEEDINKEKQPIYYTIEKDSVHYQSFPIQKKIFHKLKREKQIRFNFKQNFYDNKKSNFNSDQNQIKITRELSTEQQALQNQTEQEKQQDQTHSLYQLNNKNSVKICICYESSLNALPLKNQTNGEEFQKFSNNEQKILDEIKNQQPAQETIENKKNLIDYHPIFSFTRNLTHRDISSRIILFFQNLIFYELVSSIFIWKQNNLYQYEEINALFIICFFLISSSAKTLASLFIHIVVYLKVYISQKMKFKIQQPSLNITFRLINSFLQILFISILGIIVQCIQNPDQLRNFWILTAFNIILDLFVLDFFLIILLLKFHFKRGENWLRLKNNDLKLI